MTHGPEVSFSPEEIGSVLLQALPRVCAHEFSRGVPCGVGQGHAIHRGKWKGNEPNHPFLAAVPTGVRLQAVYGPHPVSGTR